MNATATGNKAKSAIETAVALGEAMYQQPFPIGNLTLDFANGKRIVVAVDELKPEIIAHAVLHGLKQKLVDAAAISRDPATGKAATIQTKYEAVNEVFERLMAGSWNKNRGEGGAGTGGLLFRALVRMYEGRKTPEQIKSWLEGQDDKAKAALRKNARVAALIEEIRAEDGDESKSDDLLADLDAIGNE
jgi:hypothetical protein